MTKIFISNPVARAFSPRDIGPSLAFWFTVKDASSIILNGSNAQEWRERSGYDRHMSAPAATNRPLWVSSANDGLPLLRFDGVDDILRNATTGTAGLANVTILAVLRFVSGERDDLPIILGGSISGGARSLYRANNATTLGMAGVLRDILTSNYSTDIGGKFHLFEMWNTALSGGSHVFLGRDGINNGYTPNNGGVLNLTGNGFSVGSWITDINNFASNIEVREILVFSTALSMNNLQKSRGYLMHEWNMQDLLPANHPFKNRPPLVTD
jgi:hypothetical protein